MRTVDIKSCYLQRKKFIFGNLRISGTSKKSPNVYKSCPKIISLEKLKILTLVQKLPNNVGKLGKIIFATGFEWLPKKQKIAQFSHTESCSFLFNFCLFSR